MRINCPQCGFFRELPDTKAPVTPTMATCPKCRHRFRFRPEPTPATPASHLPVGEEGVSSWRRGSPTKLDRQQPPPAAWEPLGDAGENAALDPAEAHAVADDATFATPPAATARPQDHSPSPHDVPEQRQWADPDAGNPSASEAATDDALDPPSHWAQPVAPEQPVLRRPLDPEPPLRSRARTKAAPGAPRQPAAPTLPPMTDEAALPPVADEPALARPPRSARSAAPAPQPEKAAPRSMPPAAPEISIPPVVPEDSSPQPEPEQRTPAEPLVAPTASLRPSGTGPAEHPIPATPAEPLVAPLAPVAPAPAPAPPAVAPQLAPVQADADQTPPASDTLPPETSKPVDTPGPAPRADGVRDIWARLQAMDDNRSKKRRADHHRPAEDEPDAPPRDAVVDPIPWERQDAYGFFPGLFLTLKKILLQPMEFFGSLPEGRPKTKALVFSLLISEFLLVIDFLWSLMNLRVRVGGPAQQDALQAMGNSPSLYFLAALLLVPVALSVGIYLDAWFTHLLLLLFRSNKKGFNETFRVLCYSSAPTVLSAVPVAGQLLSPIILIWYMALQAIGLKKCHEGAYTQTLAAIFIKWSIYLFLTLAVLQSITPGQ
ncbi:hypothetical protein GTA51_12540 [Desulfovibrio aerotolerans]|uniref:Yip1 domain-containing protein n=2 Tax=Solidesulfovibrio aerotolerans TaxID=295255 RepID=A0A7C9N1B8_9BACT|nr:hypothetical protein [Solidesulfovibrio aerotolerans]